MAAGVIDGRNIWKAHLQEKAALLETLTNIVEVDRLIIQPSSSLLHVPVTVENEQNLESIVKDALSFADEKLKEVVLLTKVCETKESIEELIKYDKAVEVLNHSPLRNVKEVQEPLNHLLTYSELEREEAIKRKTLHDRALELPLLPTTTIGSFPQTKEVRSQRLKWRKGELSNEQYEQYINAEIKKWIDIQEEIGLDVLVHGEFERTDMVEYLW